MKFTKASFVFEKPRKLVGRNVLSLNFGFYLFFVYVMHQQIT